MSLTGNAESSVLRGKINTCDIITLSAYGIAVKRGFKGTEEEWLLSLEANPETIKGFVNEYLESNPTTVDTTLTKEGEAAEAKAVGEALYEVRTKSEEYAYTLNKAHTDRTDNPHGVTKEQVGLGNVDNTSDMDKPVSIAQAEAIADAKKTGTDAQTAANNAQTTADNAQTAADEAKASVQTTAANVLNSAKSYSDSKHTTYTATLSASSWSSSAPYTLALTLAGILASDIPHISPVYSDTLSTALVQKEAWAMVSRAKTDANKITFYCFEDKPTTDIPILIEVNR